MKKNGMAWQNEHPGFNVQSLTIKDMTGIRGGYKHFDRGVGQIIVCSALLKANGYGTPKNR